MYKSIILAILAVSLIGCSATQIKNRINTVIDEHVYSNSEEQQPEALNNHYKILESIPFGENAVIDDRVKTECKSLGSQLSKNIIENAPKFDLKMSQISDKSVVEGVFLDVYFVNIYTRGNAFIGHRKSTAIKADLYLNNKLLSSKSIARNSNGGFFGTFKSSCSVLERTVDALGSDVAKWLATQETKIKANS